MEPSLIFKCFQYGFEICISVKSLCCIYVSNQYKVNAHVQAISLPNIREKIFILLKKYIYDCMVLRCSFYLKILKFIWYKRAIKCSIWHVLYFFQKPIYYHIVLSYKDKISIRNFPLYNFPINFQTVKTDILWHRV